MQMKKIIMVLTVMALLSACNTKEQPKQPANLGDAVQLQGVIIAIDQQGFTLEMAKGELAICQLKEVSHLSVGQNVTVYAREVRESSPIQVSVEKLIIEQ